MSPGRLPEGISLGLQQKLYLGNLEAKRDWGYAGDYVDAMWRILQHSEPGDFVVATGESHSVREFLDLAAEYAGVEWSRHVEMDPRYLRPSEVDHLLGDAAKARSFLGWKPKVGFQQLVRMMLEHDLELARQEQTLTNAGHRVVARGTAHA